jgi:hypothetical protein
MALWVDGHDHKLVSPALLAPVGVGEIEPAIGVVSPRKESFLEQSIKRFNDMAMKIFKMPWEELNDEQKDQVFDHLDSMNEKMKSSKK